MNILDFMDVIGEDNFKVVLSEFSCPKNLEIQEFMQKNAIEFAKKKTSITFEDNPSNPIYIQTIRGVGYRFNPKI